MIIEQDEEIMQNKPLNVNDESECLRQIVDRGRGKNAQEINLNG